MKTITCVYFMILLFSCNSNDKIIGEWECYGDSNYSGQLIKIENFGDSYQGLRMNLLDNDEIRGWQLGDVCWKNITVVETNKYKLSGVSKGFDEYGKYNIEESDQIIIIDNENTLLIKNFVSDRTKIGAGKERRYKKIK